MTDSRKANRLVGRNIRYAGKNGVVKNGKIVQVRGKYMIVQPHSAKEKPVKIKLFLPIALGAGLGAAAGAGLGALATPGFGAFGAYGGYPYGAGFPGAYPYGAGFGYPGYGIW